jgi:hypothetical protein
MKKPIGLEDCKREDPRPHRHGWAPGGYINKCGGGCGKYFIGAKRAYSCADCAYAQPDPAPPVPRGMFQPRDTVSYKWTIGGKPPNTLTETAIISEIEETRDFQRALLHKNDHEWDPRWIDLRELTLVHRPEPVLTPLQIAVQKAVEVLGEWLTDNTSKVFEEAADIDEVRSNLDEALRLSLEK